MNDLIVVQEKKNINKQQQTSDSTVDQLLRPLFECTDDTTDVGSLIERLNELSLPNNDDNALLQERLAYRLLTKVSDLINFTRHDDEQQQLQNSFDRALYSCGPRAILSAALQVLSTATREFSLTCLQQTLRCLRRLLLERRTGASDSCWISEFSHTELLQLVEVLLVLPVKIANACLKHRVQLPTWAVRAKYVENLVQNAIYMCVATDRDDEQQNRDVPLAYCQTLLFKLVLHGHADPVAVGIQDAYNSILREEHKKRLSGVLHASLQSFPSARYAAVLLRSIVVVRQQSMNSDDNKDDKQSLLNNYLSTTCLSTLQSSREVRESWVRLVVLSRQTSSNNSRATCRAVAMLLAECKQSDHDDDEEEESTDDDSTTSSSDDDDENQNQSILYKSLLSVASCWSTPLFVQQTDQSLQRHGTTFLLCGLELLPPSTTTNASSKLTMTLLKGVTERLHSSNQSLRLDGMRIGECVAERLGEPLKFEELEGERNRQEREETQDDTTTVRQKVANRPLPMRTSENSQNADDDDSDSVWSDELVPYDLSDDEEDLQAVPTPLYLRQCLDMLRAPESDETAYERQDMAFKTIPRLVRSRPADLVDLAVPLAKHLIFVENTFDTPGFQDQVCEGLLALAATNPISVGEYLITVFFDNVGLGKRLITLSVLEQTAHELSGEKTLHEARSERAAVMASTSAGKRVSGKRQLVSDSLQLTSAADSLEARTRRWGRARPNLHAAVKVVNEFSSVAPVWFYLLLKGFMKCREDTNLWSGQIGAKALTNFLLLLATIVQYAGHQSGTDLLATDLIELAWSFRTVADAEIRSAVLVAIGNSLAVLSKDAFASALYADSGSLLDYLRQVALEDSDETCRYLAGTLSQTVAKSVDGDRLVMIEEV